MKENPWPEKLTAGLIGSCTNSSFEDMTRTASLGQQALDTGLKPKMPLLLSPGSLKTRDTLEKAGRSVRKAWSNYASQCMWSLLWILERNRHAKGTYIEYDPKFEA